MAGEQYTFTVRYDEAMVLAGVNLFLRRTVRRQGGVLFLLLIAVGALVLVWSLLQGNRTWIEGIIGISLAVLLLATIVLRRSWRAQAVERLRRMGTPEATFTLTDDTISVVSGMGSSSTPWRLIVDVWETPSFWLLFQAPNQFFTLPTEGVPPEALAFIRQRVASP